ncbi:hypothetical protein LEP1GSC170_5663 [Leptospira interrogans serovar Bataviae str. HAI135]|nr:hypothetical protein LEP1GSC170_5663 [Leptospira interrogans serovar Bataviae str. HAI135]
MINFNFSRLNSFKNDQKDIQIEDLILAAYYGRWDNALFTHTIPIEEEIQNWQIRYWKRFKKDTDQKSNSF